MVLFITILGFSSDGDTRLLRAMKIKCNLPANSNHLPPPKPWNFFICDFGGAMHCIQDPVHIGTKLRTRLLNESKRIVIGNATASVSHLKQLINTVAKDKHLLNSTNINGSDKMNFQSVIALVQDNVRKELVENIKNSEGTIEFLLIMKLAVFSFLDKNISSKERIRQIWYVIFFLRIWRDWLWTNSRYTSDNFITSNVYNCIELNGHTLLNVICYLRDNYSKTDQQNFFRTWLFNSQPCESFFRSLRSMSTTENTVVNFSVRDVLYRIKRIDLQSEIKTRLSEEDYSFNKRHKGMTEDLIFDNQNINLPSDEEIYDTVMTAKSQALVSAFALGLTTNMNVNISIPTHLNKVVVSDITSVENENDEDEDSIILQKNSCSTSQGNDEIFLEEVSTELDCKSELQKIPGFDTLSLRNYDIGKMYLYMLTIIISI